MNKINLPIETQVSKQPREGPNEKTMTTTLAALMLAALCTIQVANTQAQEDAKKPEAAEKEDAQKPTRKKPRGRLPNYYAKLGISSKQRSEIYDIQADYKTKVEELEKQIVALEAEQKSKVEAVLSNSQKQRLAELLKEAEERSSKRRSSKNDATKDDTVKKEPAK